MPNVSTLPISPLIRQPSRRNYNKAAKALIAFHPARRFVLTAIDPEKRQPPITATFDEARYAEALTWMQKYGEMGWGLYHSPNPPNRDMDSKPKKADTPCAYYLHCDLDPKNEADIAAEKGRYLTMLLAFNPPPSKIVDSGSGLHGYWELIEPCDSSTAEAANKVLEKHFTGATQTFNVDRILRIPGTANFPNAVKRSKGRSECLCDWVEDHPERQYHIEQFSIVLVTKPPTKTGDPDCEHIDRSSIVFKKFRQLIKEGRSDEQISAFFLNSSEPLGERFRERSNPGQYVIEEIRRARDKCSDNATIEFKKQKNAGKGFETGSSGMALANRDNLKVAMALEKVALSVDVFNNLICAENVRGYEQLASINDRSMRRLRLDIQENHYLDYGGVSGFREYLSDIAEENRVHPVLAYLNSLKWDGVKRLDRWLQTYLHAEDTEYGRSVGRIHLIAGVHRIKSPGCKYDTMLVFVGEQGLGKSTAVSILAKKREWFLEDMNLSDDTKNVIENLQGKWIVEAAEMKGNWQEEINRAKNLLSRRSDKARMAYAHFAEEAPRQSIFFGSTNKPQFLYDPTGNRRFWPLDVGEVDLESLRRDVDQLWAEAVEAEKAVTCDEDLMLPRRLWEVAAAAQSAHEEKTVVYETVESLLMGRTGKVYSENLWAAMGYSDKSRRSDKINRDRNAALVKLGWKRTAISIQGMVRSGFAKKSVSGRYSRIEFIQDQRGDWVVNKNPGVFKPTKPPRRARQ